MNSQTSIKPLNIHILSQGWSEELTKRYSRFGQSFDPLPPWQLCHSANPALAFWRYHQEQQQAPAYTKNFYCADFTHIRLGMTGGRAEPLQLPAAEAKQLRQDLENAFAMLHWRHSRDAHQGYLADVNFIAPELTPLPWLYGREIRDEWQNGFRDFYRLQAEIELFLASHPVNRQRHRDAWPTVNAIWFWGKSLYSLSEQNFSAKIIGQPQEPAWQAPGWRAFADYLQAFTTEPIPLKQLHYKIFLWLDRPEKRTFQAELAPGQKLEVYDYEKQKSYFWQQQLWSNFF